MRSSTRLALMGAGLAALGLACMIAVAVSREGYTIRTTMLEKNPVKSIQNRVARQRAVRPSVVHTKVVSKGVKPLKKVMKAAAPLKKKQMSKLDLEMNGETPIHDDDFDGAGFNIEGIWDWEQRRFRTPSAQKHRYFEDLGVDMPACEDDPAMPMLEAFGDCGIEQGWSDWRPEPYEYCYNVWRWNWRERYHLEERCIKGYYWKQDKIDQEMPTGGTMMPPGDYAVIGGDCVDDKPQGVIIERTREHAAVEGGCVRACGLDADSISALDLPAGISVTLFSEEDFMGEHISFQGPQEVICLANSDFNFNDRTRSMKVFLTVGFLEDPAKPATPDRIHDENWIYPGGPDSSGVKHDVYFNQWDDPENMPRGDNEDPWVNHKWKPTVEVDPLEVETWQADVNNLY